ncbi:MAG: hypothetical protein IPJ88_13645 [Myxococcales bacterium]|nr:MAG: hypothetical protein IPJ88_13645 [Myxococcales bacterium]
MHTLNPEGGGLVRLQAGLFQRKMLVVLGWHIGLALSTAFFASWMRRRLQIEVKRTEAHI